MWIVGCFSGSAALQLMKRLRNFGRTTNVSVTLFVPDSPNPETQMMDLVTIAPETVFRSTSTGSFYTTT